MLLTRKMKRYELAIFANTKHNSLVSMAIAIIIIAIWFVSLIVFLRLDITHLPWVLIANYS